MSFLKAVFRETLAICDNEFKIEPAQWYKEIEPTKKFAQNRTMNITLVNKDSFDAAEAWTSQGFKVAVLNMANEYCPGGGVLKGCKAQEEEIARRSTLYPTLVPNQHKYPIPDFGGLYSKDVVVFRDSETYKMRAASERFKVDVITIAGIRNQHPTIPLTLELRTKMIRKIQNIFRLAAENNAEVVIAGALSCGAFYAPPNEVADLFYLVLKTSTEFHGKFKAVEFAIIDNYLDTSNYQIFSHKFAERHVKAK